MVPLGVDTSLFAPDEHARVPGRIIAIASADRPLKGTGHLLQAVAELRVKHDIELQLVAKLEPNGPTEKLIADLGITDIVHTASGLTDSELARLFASAEIAHSLALRRLFAAAVEAMASATPIVASRAGRAAGGPGLGWRMRRTGHTGRCRRADPCHQRAAGVSHAATSHGDGRAPPGTRRVQLEVGRSADRERL